MTISTLLTQKFAVIPQILTSSQIEQILTRSTTWTKTVSRRRQVPKTWPGATRLTDQDLQFFRWVQLPDGRVDIHLPPELAQALLGENEIIQRLVQELNRKTQTQTQDQDQKTQLKIVYCNLLINPPNPNIQQWHQDNGGVEPEEYYTLLIPLNQAPGMGKTEVMQPYSYQFPKSKKQVAAGCQIPNVSVGDGLLFSGCLWHRGTANLSKSTRYCLYLIISSVPEEQLFENW